MFYVYVLKDDKGLLYKGMTNDLERRLKEHKYGKTKTTKKMNNPKIVHYEECNNVGEARKREKYFKTAAGRRFLKSKANPLL